MCVGLSVALLERGGLDYEPRGTRQAMAHRRSCPRSPEAERPTSLSGRASSGARNAPHERADHGLPGRHRLQTDELAVRLEARDVEADRLRDRLIAARRHGPTLAGNASCSGVSRSWSTQ